MPVIFKEQIEEDCTFGIWEIKETYDELIKGVHLFPEERERLNGFKSDARKIEFLSVRILLKDLTGTNNLIVYSDRKKPYLHQSNFRISISHSQTLTSIMLSKTKKIGVDLEYMSHKISRIQHKFINADEFITQDETKQKYHLYIHWCAKEALYKICDKQDINFKINLTIEPFEPEDCGIITGWVDNRFWHDKFELKYFTINNYVVVYSCINS
ncbi:MAG: 4'-phosphopantetheinyl transferase superfamily protein [Bacteroidales bacterium]|nr:4'-phosphopantetheinyl transferase superfamily protein [Bacteroidales bacterium]